MADLGPPGPGHDDIIVCIEKYAQKVQSDKFFLDLLDAAIYTDKMDKDLSVVVDHGDRVELSLAVGQLQTLAPDLKVKGGTPGSDPCVVTPEDRCTPLTWLLISTNAKYEPKGVKNHWLPAFFKEQLPPKEYSQLTETAIDSLSQRIEVASAHNVQLLKQQVRETITMEQGTSEFERQQCLATDSFEELNR